MCIICNAGDSYECLDLADAYLKHFEQASREIRDASEAMLAISHKFPIEADRKRYAAQMRNCVARRLFTR